jgi:hypothetical protein
VNCALLNEIKENVVLPFYLELDVFGLIIVLEVRICFDSIRKKRDHNKTYELNNCIFYEPICILFQFIRINN